MITNELLDIYSKHYEKNNEDMNYKDASILNITLYNLLNSDYMCQDYFEIVPMYNKSEDYVWLKRNAKFIPGKATNNIVMEADLEVCGMNRKENWESIKSNSEAVLLGDDIKKWKAFEKEFSLETIDALGKDKIKNYLNIHENKIFDDLYEMLIERPSSRKLGKLIEKYGLDMDIEEEDVFISLRNEFYKEKKNEIQKFSNAMALEEVTPNKEVADFEDVVNQEIDYVAHLKEKPSDKNIEYKVFEINTEDDHRQYNKWVSKSKSPLLLTNSAWTNYGQKGLFYLTAISEENGFSKKYMIVAHNDLEVIGVTQLNDLSSAKEKNEKDGNAYKMPYIGIQQKYRGQGVASKMFEKVLEIVERDKKFLLRTSPSEMGGKFTQAKFTEMGKKLKNGILVNSDEGILYENFKEQVKDSGLDFNTKRSMYNILKEEMINRLKEDKMFHHTDAHELMSSPKVLLRFKDEIFSQKQNQESKASNKMKI